MQDLSDAGKAVLPESVPNSGTTDRAKMIELGGALLGGHVAGIPPAALAGTAAAAGIYTRPGQALARSLLAGSPQTRNAFSQYLADYRAPVGIPAAVAVNRLLAAATPNQ